MSRRSEARFGVVGMICLLALILQAGVLVVFLIGSLLFSGAQVTERGTPAWDVVIPFPVFPVPPWLLLVPAIVALLAALVWAVTARPVDSSALVGAIGPAAAAAGASGFFMFAFSDDAAPVSAYVLPLVISAATVVVLFVASVIHGARQDRAKAADARLPGASS